jgi:hypothetical protein
MRGKDFEGDVSDDQTKNGQPAGGEKLSRRRAMKVLGAGGVVAATLMLPSKWTKPVVESIIVPAHAQASAPPSTTLESTALSDIRLKRDIERVGHLASGIALYRFRYLWSDDVFVGVMAQEVLRVAPEAVIRDPSGFMSVDYARLGTRMMRWDEWLTRGYPENASDGVAIALGA